MTPTADCSDITGWFGRSNLHTPNAAPTYSRHQRELRRMQTEPWYRNGLRFTCSQCGNCCTGSAGFVWVDQAEIAAIAKYLDKPLGEIQLLHTRRARGGVSLNEYVNGDCIYLEPQSRRCRIYPVRPRQCRTWPFWRSNTASAENWEQTRQKCPGIGCGELVPLEQIEQRVSEVDL